MRVLTFGWEYPPAQSGGLGFACQGLTQELLRDGVEVIFVLPKTQETSGDARFVFADQERLVKVRHAEFTPVPYQHADSTVDVIVGYRADGTPIIKSRTIIEEAHRFAHQASVIAREEEFDVIHAHDWQTGLIPTYLKTLYQSDQFFKNTKTCFTIHNLAYQGNFPPDSLSVTSFSWNEFRDDRLEFYGKMSFIKGGIAEATAAII